MQGDIAPALRQFPIPLGASEICSQMLPGEAVMSPGIVCAPSLPLSPADTKCSPLTCLLGPVYYIHVVGNRRQR